MMVLPQSEYKSRERGESETENVDIKLRRKQAENDFSILPICHLLCTVLRHIHWLSSN